MGACAPLRLQAAASAATLSERWGKNACPTCTSRFCSDYTISYTRRHFSERLDNTNKVDCKRTLLAHNHSPAPVRSATVCSATVRSEAVRSEAARSLEAALCSVMLPACVLATGRTVTTAAGWTSSLRTPADGSGFARQAFSCPGRREAVHAGPAGRGEALA
jgi:hypothetical protein